MNIVKVYQKVIDYENSMETYNYLLNNINWTNSYYSHGERRYSRLAYNMFDQEDFDLNNLSEIDNNIVNNIVNPVISKFPEESCSDIEIIDENSNLCKFKFTIKGIYLNYYRDGNDFCPQHKHEDTIQLIISLGATRTLICDGNKIELESGDVIFFGPFIHGIPIQKEVTEGRISIAVFLGM